LTLAQAIEKYGCDATRFTLARGGDVMTDGNFKEEDANAAVLMLYTLLEWSKELDFTKMRNAEENFFDRVIRNHCNVALAAAKEEYEKSAFRQAVELGFVALSNSWKAYALQVGELGMETGYHAGVTRDYLKSLALLLAPVCPHVSEALWSVCGEKGFAVHARWPATQAAKPELLIMENYLDTLIKEIRRLAKVNSAKKEVKGVRIFIASAPAKWQQRATELVVAAVAADASLKDNFAACMKIVNQDAVVQAGGKASKKLLPEVVKKALSGNSDVSFDELEFLAPLKSLISKQTALPCDIYVAGEPNTPETKCKSQPGKPGFDYV